MRVLGNRTATTRASSPVNPALSVWAFRSGSLSPATSKPDGKTGAEQDAVVLVISTEGDTDVKHYRKLSGKANTL